MKIKTSELSGAALNWAVATLEGKRVTIMRDSDGALFPQPVWADGIWQQDYERSWALAGLIIEREGISWHCGNKTSWHAYAYGSPTNYNGPTPLIAAMRCFVASKLGDEVDVPEELA